mgnify:CR=1 FL=1
MSYTQNLKPFQRNRFLPALIMFSVLGALLFMPVTSWAQPVDEDAQEVRSIIEDIIELAESEATMNGMTLITEGNISVKPSGSYFSVTTPDLSLNTNTGITVDIGIIAMNLAKANKPGFWKTTIAYPQPVILRKADGQETGRLNIGSQRFAGLWHEVSKQFLKFDGEFRNISLSAATGGAGPLKIGSFKMLIDLEEGSDGLYSGPARYEFNDFEIIGEDGTINIEQIVMDATLDGYDINEAMIVRDDITQRLERLYDPSAPAVSDQERFETHNIVMNALGNLLRGFSAEFRISGLDINIPTQDGADRIDVRLGKIGFGVGMNNIGRETTDINWNMGYSELSSPAIPQKFDQYVASTANINMKFENLPLSQLFEMGGEMALNAEPENKQNAAMQAAMMMPQILSQSGAVVDISDTYIGNEIYRFDVDALVVADATAAHQATVDANISLKGLDTLLTSLQQTAQATQDPGQKAQISQSIQALSMVQLFGQQSPENPAIRNYNIVVDKQGQVLINGASLQQLMSGGPQGGPGAGP